MPKPLILDSLEISQFRAFKNLRIEKLGRVNLIVGKNNVGKSSFLEALWLYANQGSPSIIWEILEFRDEGHNVHPTIPANAEDPVPNIKNLFYGRREISDRIMPIRIGSTDNPNEVLSISPGWFIPIATDQGQEMKQVASEERNSRKNVFLGLLIQMGIQLGFVYRLDLGAPRLISEKINCSLISANGLSMWQIGQLWDRVSLTNLEEDVLTSLRIIAPHVERVSLINNPSTNRDRDRIAIVKVKGQEEPLTLRSLGEGMNRMFAIALALANAKDGILLIDEIESGLHYSVQPDVWRLVFKTAHKLNIQVFATTHSWDCITAFQQAAQEDALDEGVLTRLIERKGEIVADLFDEQELNIAAREEIELR